VESPNSILLVSAPAAKPLVTAHFHPLVALIDGRAEQGGQTLPDLVRCLAVDDSLRDWVQFFDLSRKCGGLLVGVFDEGEEGGGGVRVVALYG
jgi:hypothetical protein